ncbi:MAG: M23 family metallopeptidase [Acidimicrobiia bacterium]|nr:M23 family metallopeptidase [Acidimicrobiia bacterium]
MMHMLHRAVPRALLTLMLATALITIPEPTVSQADVPDDAVPFVMTAFPHDTTAVNFWDSWGARRSGGRRHKGTDIMSPRGTEVVAVADGVITDFGEGRLSGYFIKVDHGDGWATAYMHLNNDTIGTDDGEGGLWTAINPNLAVGDEVRAGDVVGYVGDSGNAEGTQPHTHFELKYDGEKINPYPYLADVWERERRLPAPSTRPI